LTNHIHIHIFSLYLSTYTFCTLLLQRFAQLQEVDLGDSEIKDFEVVDMAGRADLREDVPQEYENR
jgi:Asp-tRNA(Asn)/Glu-tRNA(Gln) amidotransferase C subunit